MSLGPTRVVPDGGWGWVIVFVSLMFHFLMGFVFSSQSVLYLALQQEFGHGKSYTSWILSVFNAMMVFVGPLSASLGVKFGYKAVTFAGGLLLGIGFFISFFATSILYLTLAIGVIAGLGAGLAYVPVIAMCALYFDKKRSLAVGLGTSGYGMGSFVFPPLVTYLEEEYTWRGVLLVICGCLLNICVLALLLRPLKTWMTYSSTVDSRRREENGKLMMNGEATTLAVDCGDADDVTMNGYSVSDLTVIDVKEVDGPDAQLHNGVVKYTNGPIGDHHQSLSRVITNEILPSPVDEEVGHNSTSKTILPQNSTMTINAMAELMKRKTHLLPIDAERSRSRSFNYRSSSTSLDRIKTKANDRHLYLSAHEISKIRNSNLDIVSHKKNRKTSNNELSPKFQGRSITNMSIMMMGSIYNIIGVDSNLNSMLSLNSKTTRKETDSQILDDDNDDDDGECETQIAVKHHVLNPTTTAAGHEDSSTLPPPSSPNPNNNKAAASPIAFQNIYHVMRDYIDLMTNCKFSLMIVINILVNLTYLIPVLFMVDRAVDNGIEKDRAVLALSMYGAGNLGGRILIGVIADLPCTNRIVLYFICCFLGGLVTSISIFFGDFLPLHNAYGFFFGAFIGGYVILTPLVLVDLLGVEMVGKSYGLLIVFNGISFLLGSPLAGWIRDMTGSYRISFALFGSFMVFSALLVVPLFYLSLKGNNKDEKDSQDEKAPLDSSSP